MPLKAGDYPGFPETYSPQLGDDIKTPSAGEVLTARSPRVPAHLLEIARRVVAPISRSIFKVATNVASIPWDVLAPDDTEVAQEARKWIIKSLRSPHWKHSQNSFSELIRAAVSDILTWKYACIRRWSGNEERAFWLEAIEPRGVEIVPEWTPEVADDIPRYIYRTGRYGHKEELFDDEMFVLSFDIGTGESASCVERAFPAGIEWLLLQDYKSRTIGTATYGDFLVCEDATATEIDELRTYFQTHYAGKKSKLRFLWKKFEKVSLKPETDENLFHEEENQILTYILIQFGLTPLDIGIMAPYHKETSQASRSSSWHDGIVPVANVVHGGLRDEVVRFFLEEFDYEYSTREPQGLSESVKAYGEALNRNAITRNEFRHFGLGLPPIQEGDKIAG